MQFAVFVHVVQVGIQADLSLHSRNVHHPLRGVGTRGQGWNPLDCLKVLYNIRGVVTHGTKIDRAPTGLEQQQVVHHLR